MALKVRDAAITTRTGTSSDNARISARNRRKTELKNLVSSYKDMDIKAFMEMVVVYYNDTN